MIMRKITSLSLALSFFTISYTGIVLFLCPFGGVARWHSWTLLGLSPGDHRAIHLTSMVTFLFFAILHISYNWRPILHYLKDKEKRISFTKKEVVIAISIHLLLIGGTLLHIQPFQGVIEVGSYLRKSWGDYLGKAPFGRAERSKLADFCGRVNLDFEKAKANLMAKNIVFKENQTLQQIAENNSIVPSEVYRIIVSNGEVQKRLPNP